MSNNQESGTSNDFANRLEQIIIRIEVNTTLLGSKLQGGEVLISEAARAVQRNVEALKVLKDDLSKTSSITRTL